MIATMTQHFRHQGIWDLGTQVHLPYFLILRYLEFEIESLSSVDLDLTLPKESGRFVYLQGG